MDGHTSDLLTDDEKLSLLQHMRQYRPEPRRATRYTDRQWSLSPRDDQSPRGHRRALLGTLLWTLLLVLWGALILALVWGLQLPLGA